MLLNTKYVTYLIKYYQKNTFRLEMQQTII